MIRIDGTISYIESTSDPLSAEVGVIRGREKIWLYDVGNSGESREEIRNLIPPAQGIGGRQAPSFSAVSALPCSVVLSHFHPDHVGNLSGLPDPLELYVGANTWKYTKKGMTVTEDLYLEDGCALHLFPLPSTHAKGSLGLEVDGEYAFLGDGLYPGRKGGRAVYNAQLLREAIDVLKSLKAHTFLLSHRKPFALGREETLRELEEIYSRREAGQPYIEAGGAEGADPPEKIK